MDLELYHQAGHNTKWNIDSLVEDGCGDGIILSPADYKMEQIESIPPDVLERSVFDPQYYLPNSQRAKFASYPFFPEAITNGFSTVDFQAQAHNSARLCLDFQINNGFRYLIIPTRFYDQMFSNYFESLEQQTVLPFLEELKNFSTDKPVYLGLAVTEHMVADGGFRSQLLNWITKFPALSGLYVIFSDDRETKQIQSVPRLKNSLEFLKDAQKADLDLIVGYCNTEGLVYGCLGDMAVTFGTFENTRRFSIDRYVVRDGQQRGPAPRIYLPGLLNWVRLNEAKVIRSKAPTLWDQIYSPTEHGEKALEAAIEPKFNSPLLYKHHFSSFQEQFDKVAAEEKSNRFQLVLSMVKAAKDNYQAIRDRGIAIETHGSGDHLHAWESSIRSILGN